MIYCVVPKPLADELYPKLVEHYRDEDNVTVIVDRREFDRRARRGETAAPRPSAEEKSRRVISSTSTAAPAAIPAPPRPPA
jgi:hypothetical protein